MLGKQRRVQSEFFVACSLGDLVPDEYVLKRADCILDLSWFRAEVAPLYSQKGRASIDPESALRLMLAGFFLGISSDRRLMSEASMHLGIRWFAGYEMHEKLPDHSSLTRLRQRWGADLFQKVFNHTVQQCIKAGLVSKTTVHVDATVVEANCDWALVASEHAKRVLQENSQIEEKNHAQAGAPDATIGNDGRKSSDPDASLARGGPRAHKMPAYKQHKAVDTQAGVIVDCEVTTGAYNEGGALLDQVDRITGLFGTAPETVTADTGYDQPSNYKGLHDRGVSALILPREVGGKPLKVFPVSRFKYDEKHDIVRCPAGKHLRLRSSNSKRRLYRADRQQCAKCPLKSQCVSAGNASRQVGIIHNYTHLLRARRRKLRRDPADIALYKCHRWRVEGSHAEAKTQHLLRRAQRRGLTNMRIQSFLSSIVMNLKRLANPLRSPVLTLLATIVSILATAAQSRRETAASALLNHGSARAAC